MKNNEDNEWSELPENLKEFLRKLHELHGEDMEIEIVFEQPEEELERSFAEELPKLFSEREESLRIQNQRMEQLYSAVAKIHNIALTPQEKQLISFAYGVGLIDGGIK